MQHDLYRLPIRKLGTQLRARAFTATQLLDHFLERIARINPALNAIVALDEAGARQAAAEADARFAAGQPLSALDGIPVAIKDNILVKGMPCVWGTELYRDYQPDHDELPVTLLKEAGAVIIGKTNVPEFTLRGFTSNTVYGPTGNPWNPELTPGGSSGGSVSAVAAGLVPYSLGTDGGGSIRRPSGYNNLVGLKPSIGRIARANGLPALMNDCEVVGPIARTSDDVRLIMATIGGANPADQRSHGFADIAFTAVKPPRLKILFVERFGDAPVDPEIAAHCRAAAEKLAALGHEVEYGELPLSIDAVTAGWGKLGNAGLAMLAAQKPDFYEKVSPAFADQARAGGKLGAAEYIAFLELLVAFRAEAGAVFETVDVIMTPSSAANPWPKAQQFPPVIDGKDAGPRGHAVFTGWVNACGHPGLALPAEPGASGMPIGFQLVGGFGCDDLLLDLAGEYEAASPWANRWPDIASM